MDFWSRIPRIALAVAVFGGMAVAQAVPAQSIVSGPPTASYGEDAQPAASDATLDPASLLPDPQPLPSAKATLVGGTIQKLDRVRDQFTVQVFGGGKMRISFDPRTHIYHNGVQASLSDLRPGDRVYIDTILDGSTVFAKNIRLKTTTSSGESQGIVVSYQRDKDELIFRDALSPRPLKIHLTSQTKVLNGDRTVSANELTAGTLVAIKFGSQQHGGDVAQEISVLAVPGASFTFAGRVTALDLRLGLIVLTSSTDHKTYEIYLGPAAAVDADNLRQEADVTVLTRFDGNHYVARSLTVNAQNGR